MRSLPYRFPFRRLGAAALLCALALRASGQGAPPLPVIELSAGMHLIHAELADNDATRMRGLMFRHALEPNHGMFFVFDSAEQHCMWMRNTLLPLSVAFIDDDGTIANIEEMQAQTDNSHCARHGVRYALEMDAGWFRAHGVRAGSVLRGVEKLGKR